MKLRSLINAVQKGKFITLRAYNRKKVRHQVKELTFSTIMNQKTNSKLNPKSRNTQNSNQVQDEMFKNTGVFPLSEWWRLFQSFYICQNTFNCSLEIYELHFM